jgi:hypothetical protein
MPGKPFTTSALRMRTAARSHDFKNRLTARRNTFDDPCNLISARVHGTALTTTGARHRTNAAAPASIRKSMDYHRELERHSHYKMCYNGFPGG